MQVKDKKDFILRFYSLVNEIIPSFTKDEDVDENSSIYKEVFNDFDKYIESIKNSLRIVRLRLNEEEYIAGQDADFIGSCLAETEELQTFLANYQLMQDD